MKMLRPLLALLVAAALAASAAAQASFPGLRAILSPDIARRAGLDQLTPDQVAILDAAISGYISQLAANQAKAQPSSEIGSAAGFGLRPVEKDKSFWSHFGLPSFHSDWRDQPVMTAKVVKWVGPNSFQLDNGQVWQGTEPIPYELVGLEIQIAPRPMGDFALEMKDKHIVVRVTRVQ